MARALFILVFFSMLSACGPAPDAFDMNGKPIYFKDYQNKWLVLNYWADWCKPCFEEVPAFNEFYNQHKNNVMIMGINFDNSSPETIQAFSKKLHIDYPMLTSNPGPQFGIETIPNLPATFIIPPDRKNMITLYGPQTKEDLLEIIERKESLHD